MESRPDVNEIARRRTLMLLAVLSGETPVSTAIEREGISRQTYYIWETRALNAILAAMVPTELAPGYDPSVTPEQKIGSLEKQLGQSERDKRRAERMLSLTRQALRAVPVKTGLHPGRPKGIPRSAKYGKDASTNSKATSPVDGVASPSTPISTSGTMPTAGGES
jgi:hypothetical protein